jgi:tetratricopeptide (TPR) repeat protein
MDAVRDQDSGIEVTRIAGAETDGNDNAGSQRRPVYGGRPSAVPAQLRKKRRADPTSTDAPDLTDALAVSAAAESAYSAESSAAASLRASIQEDLARNRPAPQQHRWAKLKNFVAARRKSDGRRWTSVRIFCSSTFRDMLGERHALQTGVLPALQVWGRERCIDFSVVDLVWGVVEGARPQETIATCLGAIDECAAANGTPFFLFLGGERYGWVPSPEDVGNDLARQYEWVRGASVTAMELLHGALRNRNPNAVFCLRDSAYAETIVRQNPQNAGDWFDSRESCEVLRETIRKTMSLNAVIRYNPLDGSTEPEWNYFIERVTSAVRDCVDRHYPLVPAPPPGLPAMRQEHALAAETLAESTVPRANILDELQSAVVSAAGTAAGCGRQRLIAVGAESGSGKTSCMAQLAIKLKRESQGQYSVIQHFVGLANHSTEVGMVARRITGEMLRLRGQAVNESCLGDDITEACALARQMLLKGRSTIDAEDAAAHHSKESEHVSSSVVVLVVDAINQLEGDAACLLDWLPNADECANLPRDVVIVVSSTPGGLLHDLETRANRPCFKIGPLSSVDSQSITERLLQRHTKRFSSSQMQVFLSNSGSKNPLWLSMAMSRLTQHAQFETLNALIRELPSTLDKLVIVQLAAAEEKSTTSLVAALLLAAALTRQGLLESEALRILPNVTRALAEMRAGLSEEEAGRLAEGKQSTISPSNETFSYELSSFGWIRLRSSLDAFLRHGPTGVLAPSHAIVHAVILERYGTGEAESCTRIVRRGVAAYFESDDAVVDPVRRTTELPWARLKLGDGHGLARALCHDTVCRQMWYLQGEASRWELLRYWREAGKLMAEASGTQCKSSIEQEDKNQEGSGTRGNNIIVEHLLIFGSALADTIQGTGNEDIFGAIELIRAVFDLLRMMRLEHTGLELLKTVQARLAATSQRVEHNLAHQAAVAWTHQAIGSCLHGRGSYTEAIDAFRQAIAVQGNVLCLSEHASLYRSLGRTHLELARVLNAEKLLDDQLAELVKAESIFSKVSEQVGMADAATGEDDLAAPAGHKAMVSHVLSQSQDLACVVGNESGYNFVTAQSDQAEVEKQLGNFFFDRGEGKKGSKELDRAVAHYTRALNLFRCVFGDNHPKTARALWGLGIVQKERGEVESSIHTHNQVLQIFTSVYGHLHQDTADMHYNIGCIYNDVISDADRRAEEARKKGERSVATAAASEADCAATLAESHLRSSLAVYIKVLGARHRDVGHTMTDVGLACLRNGKLLEAKEMLEEAVSIRLESLGTEHPDTQESQAALDKVKSRMVAVPEANA